MQADTGEANLNLGEGLGEGLGEVWKGQGKGRGRSRSPPPRREPDPEPTGDQTLRFSRQGALGGGLVLQCQVCRGFVWFLRGEGRPVTLSPVCLNCFLIRPAAGQ